MYYDRVPSPEVLDLLRPGGPLGWLVDLTHDPATAAQGAVLQLRRSAGARARGSVQLYLGRTSPLEVVGAPAGAVELRADATYRALAPDLFGRRFAPDELASLAPRLREHVARAAAEAPRSFLDGEAGPQAGLLRRYGPLGRPGDPLVALDSEVVVGFASMSDRKAYETELQTAIGRPDEGVHRELDVIGVLPDGAVAIVELKDERGDLAVAAAQAASHVHRFRRLAERDPAWTVRGLTALAEAKHRVGLLPAVPVVASPPRLVPVIAAPDRRDDWADRWADSLAPSLARWPELLGGLRVWRLSSTGELLDEAVLGW